MEPHKNAEWSGRTDGTTRMQHQLIALLRILPLQCIYAFAALFVVPFYMLSHHKEYIAQYRYFRRRIGRGRFRSFCSTYRNHCLFSQVVLDRFYMFGGGRFRLLIDHYERYERLNSQPQGFVIISSHIGCYEVAGYTLRSKDKRFYALVYGGESETVLENRRRIMGLNNIGMILVKEDMSHIFELSRALDNGDIVSIPGDRIFGSSKFIRCRFMGSEAKFPMGPFAIAAQRGLPVLQISVMKEKYDQYHVYIEEISQDLDRTKPIREQEAVMAQRYAGNMETLLRRYPEQWYNFYSLWES